jgi:hypothetical protein
LRFLHFLVDRDFFGHSLSLSLSLSHYVDCSGTISRSQRKRRKSSQKGNVLTRQMIILLLRR